MPDTLFPLDRDDSPRSRWDADLYLARFSFFLSQLVHCSCCRRMSGGHDLEPMLFGFPVGIRSLPGLQGVNSPASYTFDEHLYAEQVLPENVNNATTRILNRSQQAQILIHHISVRFSSFLEKNSAKR